MSIVKVKPIIFIVASKGYQPTEYQVPLQFLEKNGVHIITASDKKGTVTASDNSTTTATLSLTEIDPQKYAGIFFIGGFGALECLDNQVSYDLIMRAHDLGVPYGAICISPRILAKAGALRWKKATGWNEDKKLKEVFENDDVTYEPMPVVVDGNVITAEGPTAALLFAQEIFKIVAKSE